MAGPQLGASLAQDHSDVLPTSSRLASSEREPAAAAAAPEGDGGGKGAAAERAGGVLMSSGAGSAAGGHVAGGGAWGRRPGRIGQLAPPMRRAERHDCDSAALPPP
ncbi:hypothetical protein FOA52_014724 [Chlamydomonas sp. UWO 241]|nr:hypothetical protein FOA52_014724 [Chlamydomonas sp. UWO 241]